MPFAYYGAKHGLAPKYPRPRYPLIIEPFAGAAGYSCHWAHLGRRVLLCDLDALVIETWERIRDGVDLDALTAEVARNRTGDPLIASMCGSSAWSTMTARRDRQVTPRMRQDWPMVRERIRRVSPYVWRWEIRHGDYRHLPLVEATWFVDPPYQPLVSTAGNDYVEGASGIDYDELGEWCRSLPGQVIVCEQSPAAWLPFTPIARQGNGASNADTRTEVVWLSDQQQLSMF